ncbi:MAG: DUF456 domain-containing protein [Bacteroidales bacterium]|jgi:uncharacterized protein YqgC (DUF456 family)|nr:DUF456 domain-containing protein [Bacteroidales bacterium]
MDFLLLALGILLIIIGLVGCILPIIPGPPLSFLGLLMLHLTKFGEFSSSFLILMATIAIIVTILDYIVPIWGTKKFGGSKAGIWGSTIGLIIGIFFFPPIGLIIGPLIGAIVAELIKGADFNKSLKSGLGSFLGFLLGTGLKLISSSIMSYYFFTEWI